VYDSEDVELLFQSASSAMLLLYVLQEKPGGVKLSIYSDATQAAGVDRALRQRVRRVPRRRLGAQAA
jgi:hypothetical protein